MEQTVIILSAKQWEMNTESGERRGTTVWYIPADNIAETVIDQEDGTLGHVPCKCTMDYDVYNQIKKNGGAPLTTKVTMKMKKVGNGITMIISNIHYKI